MNLDKLKKFRIRELSIDERIRLYNKALRIKKKTGWGRVRIGRALGISSRTVNYWINGDVDPTSRFNLFNNTPSFELNYLIGVIYGDGCVTKDGFVRLDAKDKDFVENFANCINKISQKRIKIKEFKKDLFTVQFGSMELCRFLDRGIDALKPIIEKYPEYFVRGLADSEGSPSISIYKDGKRNRFDVRIHVAMSTNINILKYTQNLLKKFFLIKSSISLNKKMGAENNFDGRIYKTTKNCYKLAVDNFNDIIKFSKFIGFSIQRKNEKLIDAVNIKLKFGGGNIASQEWRKLYNKINGLWVKIKT